MNIIKHFIFTLILFSSFLHAKDWQEIKVNDEVIIVRESENSIKAGQIFARKDETTYLLVASDLGKVGEIAKSDIQKYLPLACGCKIEIEREGKFDSKKNGFTIVLATTNSTELINWTEIDYPKELDEQECFIKPVNNFKDGTEGIILIGGSKRGLLNGLYTLLEKSADIWWEPVRELNPQKPLYSNISETILSHSNALVWEGESLIWKPVVKERVIYMNFGPVTKRSVDWASRNRMSHFVISTPRNLPMTAKEEKHIKTIIDYAHERGLKVLFLNMTHRLPSNIPVLPASSDEAIKLSTKLYLEQFKRFGVDGMAWHSASEGIHVHMDEEYKKQPRVEWEAKYFNSYYKAIRKVNKDAILVMLMGWVYMNPAERLAELLPDDVVAWVVPYTPIIDASLTDLDSYSKNFKNIWYWLYVVVSRDGVFPTVKTDYLEKYFREAIKRGHGLAPQAVLVNNNENAMYFAQVARDGIIPNQDFLKSFGKRYYGDPTMGEALIKYQDALFFHRNWYNNIHTVDINYYLTFQERDYLKEVFNAALNAGRNAQTPLIKDRLKVLTITVFRCLYRRSVTPKGNQKDWNDALQQLYEKNLEEFLIMINEIKAVYPESYFGRENDYFLNELLSIENSLKN